MIAPERGATLESLHRRALAHVDLPPGGRHPDRARAVRAARHVRSSRCAGGSWRRRARGASFACGRCSPAATPTRPTTRTPRSGSTPTAVGAARDAGGRTTACPAVVALAQRRAIAPSRSGIAASSTRGAGARARRHRGPRLARHLHAGISAQGDAVLVLGAGDALAGRGRRRRDRRRASAGGARAARARSRSPLERAADAYLVRRGEGKTIVAGYPWFTDWGRDTFIALRGLCLATGRLADARDDPARVGGPRLRGHAAQPLPRPGRRARVQLGRCLALVRRSRCTTTSRAAEAARPADVPRAIASALGGAVQAILDGYARGTRYGIRVDDDGLLAAGEPGVQLTWMDAKVGDWVVTPRIGKPVEIQALWLNALRIAERVHAGVSALVRARRGGVRRALLERRGGLPLRRGRRRPRAGTARPAVPAQPDLRRRRAAVPAARGRAGAPRRRCRRATALDAARAPHARARRSHGYRPRYEGGVRARDGAYHRARSGPGCSVRSSRRGCGCAAAPPRRGARRGAASSQPLLAHLNRGGLGHISEIADAEPPHTPRGCPFQAWSVGEALRLDRRRARRGSGPATKRRVHARQAGAPARYDPPGSLARVPDRGGAARPLHDLGVRLHGAAGHPVLTGAPAPSPTRPSPRLLMGLAMGATAIALDLFALGHAVGRALQSRDHAHLPPARQGRAARRARVHRRAVRRRQRRRAVPWPLLGCLLADPATRFAATLPGRRGAGGVRRPRPASHSC